MTARLSTQVNLFMRAMQLKNKDLMSKNDPFVIVSMRAKPLNDDAPGAWQEVYRSSTVENNNNPQWADPAVVEYRFEEMQYIKFEIYDRDSSSESLGKHDFLGSVETTMSKIMGSRGTTFSGLLVDKNGKSGKIGKFAVTGQERGTSRDVCEFRLSASKLARKNMMGLGRSDPFYVISREMANGSFVKVFESEVLKSTTQPLWQPQKMLAQTLSNEKNDSTLRFEVFDWESSGKHKFIGGFNTSLIELQDQREFSLTDPKSKKAETGLVKFESFSLVSRFSFLDYISGGCELKLTVAVDFTASNGFPQEPDSLHFRHANASFDNPKSLNEYQKALLATGQILQDYDSDKMFTAYGFGGKSSDWDSSVNIHCFSLTLDEGNPEVAGVEGLFAAYNASLEKVKLHGPTYFKDLIAKTIENCEEATQENQAYETLLILTDGEIFDMPETIANLVTASYKPMSVIIVGVGQANFSKMEALDCDAPGQFLSSGGRTAMRDIVQFVPFRKFNGQSFRALAEETLRELPTQIEQFFEKKGIKPNQRLEPSPEHFIVADAEVVEAVATVEGGEDVPVAFASQIQEGI